MKVLEYRCERSPLDDAGVIAKLNRPGFTKVLWRCPDCRARWVAHGTRHSKTAGPARWFWGWF